MLLSAELLVFLAGLAEDTSGFTVHGHLAYPARPRVGRVAVLRGMLTLRYLGYKTQPSPLSLYRSKEAT